MTVSGTYRHIRMELAKRTDSAYSDTQRDTVTQFSLCQANSLNATRCLTISQYLLTKYPPADTPVHLSSLQVSNTCLLSSSLIPLLLQFVLNRSFLCLSRNYYIHIHIIYRPIPVAAQSKAWVYGRSIAGIVGSNPAKGMDVCLL
jgi:hypothetical protein